MTKMLKTTVKCLLSYPVELEIPVFVSFYLLPYAIFGSSEGPGETVCICRLV